MKKNKRIRNEAQMNNFNNSTIQPLNISTSDGADKFDDIVEFAEELKRLIIYLNVGIQQSMGEGK